MSARDGLVLARLRCAIGALLMVTAGCNWGTRPRDFAPARSPSGASVAVRVRGEGSDRRGELYAADSMGVTIRGATLLRIAWQRVAAIDVRQLGARYDIRMSEAASREQRERLALVSRFPQGLSGPLLERVLGALRQPALEEIR